MQTLPEDLHVTDIEALAEYLDPVIKQQLVEIAHNRAFRAILRMQKQSLLNIMLSFDPEDDDFVANCRRNKAARQQTDEWLNYINKLREEAAPQQDTEEN